MLIQQIGDGEVTLVLQPDECDLIAGALREFVYDHDNTEEDGRQLEAIACALISAGFAAYATRYVRFEFEKTLTLHSWQDRTFEQTAKEVYKRAHDAQEGEAQA